MGGIRYMDLDEKIFLDILKVIKTLQKIKYQMQ